MSEMQDNVNFQEHFSPEKWFFIDWLATPRSMRKPSTQKELAEYLNLNPVTLSRWKCEEDVRKSVYKRISQYAFDHVPDIIEAIRSHAIRGSVAHAKMFMEYITPVLTDAGNEEFHTSKANEETISTHGEPPKKEIKTILGYM